MKHQIKWKKHIFHVKNEQGILGSVPTELSKIPRTYQMVEPRGVEPLSCDVIMTISTCLFCLYCFSSSGFADRQAAFRLAHLKSRTQTDE